MNAQQLLALAKQSPNAQDTVQIIESTVHTFWSLSLGLNIDRNDFTARYLQAWMRGSIEGITLDEVQLAAIIEASAHLKLTFQQLQKLREDIRRCNDVLIQRFRATRELSSEVRA